MQPESVPSSSILPFRSQKTFQAIFKLFQLVVVEVIKVSVPTPFKSEYAPATVLHCLVARKYGERSRFTGATEAAQLIRLCGGGNNDVRCKPQQRTRWHPRPEFAPKLIDDSQQLRGVVPHHTFSDGGA